MRLSRVYLWSIAAIVIAGVVMVINQFSGMVYLRFGGEIFVSLLLALAYSVIGLVCAAVCENGKARIFMRSGMILGFIAIGCCIAMTFIPAMQMNYTPIRLFIWPTVWAALMMLVGVLLLLPMHDGWRRTLRSCAIILLSVLALYVAAGYTFYPGWSYSPSGVWNEDMWRMTRIYEEVALRGGLVLVFLAAAAFASSVIIGVMTALSGRAVEANVVRKAYWLQCPRCGQEQEALTGEHHCTACKLRTKVVFA
jgi:hypothetical protein